MLSFGSGSAIKRIKAGVKAPPLTVPCQSFDLLPGLHPPVKVSFERKRIQLSLGNRKGTTYTIGR
jgi:hypothetical protein